MMHVVGRVLCHAAHGGVFGIVGAAIRYALALAFAQGYGLDVTAKDSALFVDLPANMLGCFVVALIADGSALRLHGGKEHASALFPPTHRIHAHACFWAGLRAGLCGSLTTFASWNTQMVRMITAPRGVLVARAICGWLLGTQLAASSYAMGNHAALSIAKYSGHARAWRPPAPPEASSHCADEKVCDIKHDDDNNNNNNNKKYSYLVDELVVGVTFVALWAIAAVGVALNWHPAELWVGCLSAPFGVYLRVYLARWNAPLSGAYVWQSSTLLEAGEGDDGNDNGNDKKWFPWGTFAANIIASVFDAFMSGAMLQCTTNCEHVLTGLELGLGGSLSTVSTWMADFHLLMNQRHGTVARTRAYWYLISTLFVAASLSIAVYAGMRYGWVERTAS